MRTELGNVNVLQSSNVHLQRKIWSFNWRHWTVGRHVSVYIGGDNVCWGLALKLNQGGICNMRNTYDLLQWIFIVSIGEELLCGWKKSLKELASVDFRPLTSFSSTDETTGVLLQSISLDAFRNKSISLFVDTRRSLDSLSRLTVSGLENSFRQSSGRRADRRKSAQEQNYDLVVPVSDDLQAE